VILITRIPFIDLIADGGTSVFKIFAVFWRTEKQRKNWPTKLAGKKYS
jgi:hypothetical protein